MAVTSKSIETSSSQNPPMSEVYSILAKTKF